MTVYSFSEVIVFDRLGDAVRVAANVRVTVTDPATGLTAAGLTQNGQPVPWVTSDGQGHADFTATVGSVQIAAPNGLTRTLTSATWVKEQADAAKSSADAAAQSASTAAAPTDGMVANVVNTNGSQTQVAMDARYTAPLTTYEKAVNSKGTDLVTNGTGLMGDATNFSGSFTFSGADAPTGANGSFVAKVATAGSFLADEFVPFDPSKPLRMSFQARQTVAGAVSKMYAMLVPYDVGNAAIAPAHYMFITGTQTTLAADLKPGDTVVHLTSAANWYGSTAKPAGTSTFYRAMQFWNWTDSAGKTWPAYSYTRNLMASDSYADGSVDTTANTITLRAAYAGTLVPAGTSVSQPSAGAQYLYMPSATNVTVPETWTKYADTFQAGTLPAASQSVTATGAASWTTGMPPATAKLKIGWLLNYAPTSGLHAVAAVSLSDAAAANAAVATKLDTTVAASTYVPKSSTFTPVRVVDLPNPAYFAHAGGMNLAPVNSWEAYRNAFGMPGKLPIDCDVKYLRDGALPMLHDTVTGNVTTTSANVEDMHGGAARRLRLDPARWFCHTWTDTLPVPDFRDVLREFGNRRVLVPEIETITTTGGGQAVADAIVAAGCKDSVLVQSTALDNIRALVAAGVPTMWLSAYGQHGADINETTAKNEGCTWVGIDGNDPANAASTITRFHGAGLKVAVYTLDRRVDRDTWLAAGVDAIWSNDPWYLNGSHPIRTTDPFSSQSYYHGHIAAAPSTGTIAQPRGYYASGGWGLDCGAAPQFQSVLQGWASPIKGSASASSFTIDFTTTWETQPDAGFSQMCVFLSPDDAQWDDTLSPRRTGWLFSTRPNGNMLIYKSDGTTVASVGSTMPTLQAQALNTARAFRIVVTPTTLTFSVPSIAGYSTTVTDSALRGGFMHLSVTNAKGRFSGITVS